MLEISGVIFLPKPCKANLIADNIPRTPKNGELICKYLEPLVRTVASLEPDIPLIIKGEKKNNIIVIKIPQTQDSMIVTLTLFLILYPLSAPRF